MVAAHRASIVLALDARVNLAAMRGQLAPVAQRLLLHTHLIYHTLRDALVMLCGLRRPIALLPLGRRLGSLLSCGSSVDVLHHIATLLTAISVDIDWGRHDHFVRILDLISLHYLNLDRGAVTQFV